MSNIGKLPIKLPTGVTVELSEGSIKISGPKGSLSQKLSKHTSVKVEDAVITVSPADSSIKSREMHGTIRALISNMVGGVTEGWTKTLEMVGTGYRAEVRDKNLVLNIGYSHPVIIDAPEGITFEVTKSVIKITGIDKELVGLISDRVRSVRPPEPYKGKGIKYQGEIVRRKAGKAAKTAGAK
jgi:large subunit ribosomal protein L6